MHHPLSTFLLALCAACAPIPPDAQVPLAPDAVDSRDGLYRLELEAVPQPYIAGRTAELYIEVASEGGLDPTAEVSVKPWMPDHDHGISPGPVVEVDGDGRLRAEWVFSMPGYWELTLQLDGVAGSDRAVVAYEVD